MFKLNYCVVMVWCVSAIVCGVLSAKQYSIITAEKEAIKTYSPTWESLDSRPLPQWYDRAKVGIFVHWGVYSVPTFGSEWFWTNWRNLNNTNYVDYMNKNFKPGFTYQEFAPQFTAEHFNATEWATLFEESGAKYVVLTSKHHDGFTLWPSKYSFSWNSVDIGPHRNIISEFADSIRTKTKLKFGLYHSLYEWFNPMYLSDKQKSFNDNIFVENKIIPEMKELINEFKPEVLWSDGDWEASYEYWNSTEFIAWLYNESPVRKTIVTNDRWGIGTLCEHGDFLTCSDRFNPGELQKKKWENAMTIDKRSWGYRADARLEDFLSTRDLIKELVITVSCGGNILINVGPTQTGIIQPIFVERLRALGHWLDQNGDGIYESSPWVKQNDTHPGVWYTSKVNRNDPNRIYVYAFVLEYPYDSEGVNLTAFRGKSDEKTTVRLLGYNQENLKWIDSWESMYITFPDKRKVDKLGLEYAWTLKIDLPRMETYNGV